MSAKNNDDHEETVREMIHREDQYRSSRLGWFCTLQGLLFAALGLITSPTKTPPIDDFISVIVVLGLAISVITVVMLGGTTYAIRQLVEYWENNRPEDYQGPGVIAGHTRLNPLFMNILKSPVYRYFLGYFEIWTMIPFSFTCAWIYILTKL